NAMHQGRTALIWRAGGMIWLVSVTLLFALLDLYFAKLSVILTISTAIVIVGITAILFTSSVKTLYLSKLLPFEKSGDDLQGGVSVRKWFFIILILEIAGLNIASISLLKSDHFQYIVPVDILIVSLHFIPLARIFAMPVYYALGIMVSLIAIFSMFLVSSSSHIGNLIAIAAIPSLCFIFLNWITIIYVLKDGMKYLRKR
ncbi:MAG: hypothetical protein ACXVAU_02685, partial [Mucilaginibacter sp.]